MIATAYYNENDENAAAWLRELIRAGLIAPGDVDTRSILDVTPNDLRGYAQCHFFAGIGGWSYALRCAGVADHFPIWTGSCPCQPFSAAGKRLGFADDRHLWPYWRYLIAQRRPAIVFGEQVAQASDWLRLVRSDLEGMGYAVGAEPIEAASAGADHLRDRYWFVGADTQVIHVGFANGAGWNAREPASAPVGHGCSIEPTSSDVADNGERRRAGAGAGKVQQPGRAEAIGTGDHGELADTDESQRRIGNEQPSGQFAQQQQQQHSQARDGGNTDLANADDAGSQGRGVLRERGSERPFGANGMADSDVVERWVGDEQSAGQQPQQQQQQDTRARDSCAVADAYIAGSLSSPHAGIHRGEEGARPRYGESQRHGVAFEWVIGADGKARRVKSGIRLLADGFPCRVGLLRGFGNAIDPRPAAAFIRASIEALTGG